MLYCYLWTAFQNKLAQVGERISWLNNKWENFSVKSLRKNRFCELSTTIRWLFRDVLFPVSGDNNTKCHCGHWCYVTEDLYLERICILINASKVSRCDGAEHEGRVAIRRRKSLLCVWHILKTLIYAESLKHKPPFFFFFFLLPLCHCLNLIQRRVIVFLHMQTSRSILGAPWAEMMCKIAFLEACEPGRGGIMKETHHD